MTGALPWRARTLDDFRDQVPQTIGLTRTMQTIVAACLMRDPASYKMLFDALYDDDRNGGPDQPQAVVRTLIHRARAILALHGINIVTAWGIGYRIPLDDRHKLIALRERERRRTGVVSIELTTPPSVNNLFRNLGRGGRAPTQAYRDWQAVAGHELASQRPGAIAGPYEITIAIPPTRGDLDNYAKATLDLLVTHGVVEGDGPKFNRCITLERVDELTKAVVTVMPWQPRSATGDGRGVAETGGGLRAVSGSSQEPRAAGVSG